MSVGNSDQGLDSIKNYLTLVLGENLDPWVAMMQDPSNGTGKQLL